MQKIDYQNFFETGISFLKSAQQRDGSFLSLSSSKHTFHKPIVYHTTFINSLILLATHSLPKTERNKSFRDQLAHFLLSQKSSHWSWNYWHRNSVESKEMPYPDDLDDTFCALAALFLYDQNYIDGKAMVNIVQLLTNTEVTPGGPYTTWIVEKKESKKWGDTDLAVNSNIAYFLSLHEITLPKLNMFIERHVKKNVFISPYYPSLFPIIYFISRFYTGDTKDRIISFLLAQKKENHSWGNPLNTSLALSAFLNLGGEIEAIKPSILYLIEMQQKRSYKAYPFYMDPSRDGQKYFGGSPALTTAFCLEAVAKYFFLAQKINIHNIKKIQNDDKLYNEIITTVLNRFTKFDKKSQTKIILFIQQMLKKDSQKQIPLIAYFFSLNLNRQKEIPKELVVQLGVANVFGWIAYTIYDNFLDNQGDKHLLSIANVSLREASRIFEQILPQTTFPHFFREIMDQLDNANLWEIAHCRITMLNNPFLLKDIPIPTYSNNYRQLAQKSLGHALGPLALLFFLGYKKNSPQIKYCLNFFTHYLILKQLNDDAHDWEEDLRLGQINAVSALIFKRLDEKNIQRTSLNKLIPKLQKIFWHHVIDDIAAIALKQNFLAKKALKKCDIFLTSTFLEEMLAKQMNGIQKAVDEKNLTLSFIKHYGK